MMGAIFEPKGPYQRSHRICTLGELLDMYHSHEVSLQHDKVYALLGLCSDDISETGLLPNYNTRWNDILETLVRFLLYKEIHIERSPNIERTLIKGTAYVLGSISSLHLYSTSDGREGVEVKWRTMKDTTEDSWTRRSDWALRPSAKPVMVGDVICLFHGASKPIIIRICEDHCFIIQIAPTPPPDVRIKGEDVKWLNFEQMARRFPVRYLQCVWDWGTLPEISQTQGDVEQSRIDLPRMIGIWNSMRILEEAGAPREAEILFRKLMRTYEESTGQDGLRDTIANHLCRMTDVDMCYINKSYDLAPLSWAADEGYMAVVDLLVKHDEASIDFVGGWGYTPLICAARSDHLDVVERLLRENLEINRSTAIVGPVAMKITALQAAAERGHFTIVERLLQAGADVNAEASPDEGRTALQAASEGGHIEIVERLLKEKADINAAAIDHRGITALQAAAAQGHLTIVERLLQAGADVNSKAAKLGGRTALQAASEGGYTTIVERLLKARAYVNAAAAEREGTTALHAAVKAGHITIVDRLLQEGADVNAVGLHGWRVLHQAACKGHFIVLVRLLEAQPDVHAIDKNEKTALHLAAESGHLEIVERLLQEGADVNAAAYNDSTALWIATRRGHLDIVERLRQAGAKE
jgi:ankyrin repeat protein